MNPSIKQAWIEALRSGEYKQGTGCLREDDRYCCLGVLVDLHIKKHDLEWEKLGEDYHFDGSAATLPAVVLEWAGLHIDNPTVNGLALATWNDSGESFQWIADLIEETL